MNSPLSYFGGKSRLAPRIISMIPKHTCYVEPFCGAAWVFFKKPESRVEVLNDLDNNIVNLYRVIQHHPEEFSRQFRSLLISRKLFELLKLTHDETLTDIHRAVKWFYFLKQSFASIITPNSAFGYSTKGLPRLNLNTIEETIIQIHWRLAKVYIENKPYADILERYDRPHTFFYLDPPYYEIKGYRFDFKPEDFMKMAEVIGGLKGRFILSLNDHKEVRQIFSRFRVSTVPTKYSSMNGRHSSRDQPRHELLIRNY